LYAETNPILPVNPAGVRGRAWPAGFFTTEVLSWRGLLTYYTLFVMVLRSRLVQVCGTTVSPDSEWMKQVARQLSDAMDGFARGKTHLIIDRDTKYCSGFREMLESAGIQIVLCHDGLEIDRKDRGRVSDCAAQWRSGAGAVIRMFN